MPPLKSRHIAVAFDMHGCPNACRHCYLGRPSGTRMSENDVRWGVRRFREYVREGETEPFFHQITFATWFREPDFPADYRRLYELEVELSDGEPARYELLSIWRLARDPSYAKWARGVGLDTCQVTFFGMETTNDWFHRRTGAFRDNVSATDRLIEAGIKPRWQFFLTRAILPELGGLMRLIDRRKLRKRVAALGGEFVVFIHTPSPDGEGRLIEHLRPTVRETRSIPTPLIESSRKHLSWDPIWRTEAEWHAEIMTREDAFPHAYASPEKLWFFVTVQFDVYTNIGTLEPWWRLGNLKRDGVGPIVEAFETHRPLGLKTIYTVPARELAELSGDPVSSRVYSTREDLEGLYLAKYCEQVHGQGR